MKKLLLTASLAAFVTQSQAGIIQFDLMGLAGIGLLPGNETGAVNGTPGSGGELPGGIFYDDVSDMLTINVGWGSANGFNNLTGNTTLGHLHGPTAAGGAAAFGQTAGAKYTLHTLPGWNSSASAGGYSGTISIVAADEASLLNGQFYLNVHTAVNGGGEIRGNLVVVPEPSVVVLGVLGAGALLFRLRRRN
jgi:CHRD domain